MNFHVPLFYFTANNSILVHIVQEQGGIPLPLPQASIISPINQPSGILDHFDLPLANPVLFS